MSFAFGITYICYRLQCYCLHVVCKHTCISCLLTTNTRWGQLKDQTNEYCVDRYLKLEPNGDLLNTFEKLCRARVRGVSIDVKHKGVTRGGKQNSL